MVRTKVVWILLALMVTLAACGGGEVNTPAEPTAEIPIKVSGTAPTLDEDYPDAMPVLIQLMAGTMLLEETPHLVTAAQAQELLLSWQMLQALQRSGTASQVEIDVTFDPIQAAMTVDQLATIKEMCLTADDVRDMAEKLGISGSGLPAGISPADMMSLSAEERAELMATVAAEGLMDKLIELLEARAREA